jgi:subtilisin-like proprotein convertase family protein
MKNTILFSLLILCFKTLSAQNEDDCGVFSYEHLLIPDDQSIYHETSIEVSNGIAGETINSLEDLSSVWINMEHSFIADLVITVVCPNGQSITLHNQGGGGAQLGLPNQNDDEVPGTGWDYWWSPTPNYGTLVEEANGGSLPSGVYESVEPWTELLGCPVNGQWTLQFADMWPSDNGYLFGWGIVLDQSVIDGECQEINIPGCTDETATNFNPEANLDDGSCQYLSGCTEMFACNYNPNAIEDDGSCEYESCKNVQIEWISSEYTCDTTVVIVHVEDVTPENSVVYIYDNTQKDNLLVSVIEGGTYYLPFTNDSDTMYENLAVFILVYPFEEEVFYELNPPISFEVFTSPEQPITVDNGGTLECINCDQDADDLAWILNWDDSPQEDIIQDSTTISVPESFSGTVKVCLGNADCYSCSEELMVVGIVEETYTNLQVLSNGISPVIVSNERGELQLFDSSGKIVFRRLVSQGQMIEIDHLSTGLYQAIFGEQIYRIVISR